MRFLVVNPNTSAEMTKAIEQTVAASLHGDNQAEVITASMGPRSLESFYEYSLASVGVIATLKKLDLEHYQGMLLACFGDPGLYALKETMPFPVVGIAEAALSLALLLGYRFAILAASEKAVPMMENMVQQYGLSSRLAGVFPLGMAVLDLEVDRVRTIAHMLEVGRRAVAAGAEVLLLGCAGMTGFAGKIEDELGVVVVDPIIAGVKTLEAIVESGLKVCRRGLYAAPAPKEVLGMEFIEKT